MLDHPRTLRNDHVAPGAAAARRPSLAQRLLVPLLRRRRKRAAIAALEGLGDRLLADIGLSRDDIPYAVDALLVRDPAAETWQGPDVAAATELRAALRRAA